MKARQVSPEAPYRCTCAWCGQEFGAGSGNAQYCSMPHKQKHYRWRTKAGQFGREAIVKIDNLKEYCIHGGEMQEIAEAQLNAIIERAKSALVFSKIKGRLTGKEKETS